MESHPDDYHLCSIPLLVTFSELQISSEVIIALIVVVVLLAVSALVSGSEVAFFSLSRSEIEKLKNNSGRSATAVNTLLDKPSYLLATILIANNFVNVGIVIFSYFAVHNLIAHLQNPLVVFAVEVVLVTFLLVLFGEVMPKIYASQNRVKFASRMSFPLYIAMKIFMPFSYILVSSTTFIEKRLAQKVQNGINLEEFDRAIDIAVDDETSEQDVRMLKGIVKFGNIAAKQIMCSHVDIVGVEYKTEIDELLRIIRDSGYSRIPVWRDDKDNIAGIFYAKDLLPLQENNQRHWQDFIREAYFVPENKKIDDLLKEFQKRHTHMAIVVDEYGGTSGLVTLEDTMEEVIGEIEDEYDEQDIEYRKLDERTYMFSGKCMINDMCKVLEINPAIFRDIRGDSDSLAGLVLEIAGRIPSQGDELKWDRFVFKVASATRRRLERIQIEIEDEVIHEEKN